MARDRYHYDHKGRLKGVSSDDSPLQRGCARLMLWVGGPLFLIFLYVAGSLEDRQAESSYVPGESPQQGELTPQSDFQVAPAVEPSENETDVTSATPVEVSPNIASADEVGEFPVRAVESAMQQAFETGEPTRWEGGDLAGYAVPSAAQVSTGCRGIYYSIDSRAGWQSPVKMICP